jgi:hypothetical protein
MEYPRFAAVSADFFFLAAIMGQCAWKMSTAVKLYLGAIIAELIDELD